MPVPTKKRPPLEMEPGEGKAHEMSESSSEEVREGSEADEKQSSHSRKRSAKGSKNTKAPMDAEGGCCNEKKGKGKCPTCAAGGACRGDAALTPHEYLAACELGIQDRSRTYIRARLDADQRLDLKCGKGSISQGEKCSKGAATKAKGPSALIQTGQVAKNIGRGALETVKWTSGYNIGKTIATGMTQGKNEKAGTGSKVASVAASTLVFGVSGGLGAARRVGAFGNTDLQQHAINEKKEKKWRKSVGYRDGMYAKGFAVDYAQL